MAVTTTSRPMFVFFSGTGEAGTATITANNFAPPAANPASNLGNSQLITSTCRTPDLTTDRILAIDLLAAKEVNCFGLMGCNATLSATGRFRAANDAAFTSGVIESGSGLSAIYDSTLGNSRAVYVPPWGRTILYIHPTSITRRYYRWHQSDATNPDGYQEWSILRLGLGWQSYFTVEKITSKLRFDGPPGSEKVIREIEIVYHNLTKAEAYDLQSIFSVMLSTRRVLLIPRPLEPATWLQEVIWCTLDKSFVRDPVSGLSGANARFRVVATFIEADR